MSRQERHRAVICFFKRAVHEYLCACVSFLLASAALTLRPTKEQTDVSRCDAGKNKKCVVLVRARARVCVLRDKEA